MVRPDTVARAARAKNASGKNSLNGLRGHGLFICHAGPGCEPLVFRTRRLAGGNNLAAWRPAAALAQSKSCRRSHACVLYHHRLKTQGGHPSHDQGRRLTNPSSRRPPSRTTHESSSSRRRTEPQAWRCGAMVSRSVQQMLLIFTRPRPTCTWRKRHILRGRMTESSATLNLQRCLISLAHFAINW